jgi:hypothetical protein
MDLPESASPEFQATRTESHVFLGYLLAVPTALSAFMLMGQPPTTRFEWVRIPIVPATYSDHYPATVTDCKSGLLTAVSRQV